MKNVLIIFFILFIGCDKDKSPTDPTDNDNSTGFEYGYYIETDPTISSDRNYVFFVATDTSDNEISGSGIYYARVVNPIRKLILRGDNYRNPVPSPNNQLIAFIKSGNVKIFNRILDTTTVLTDYKNYSSIIFLNDSILLAEHADTIYQINIGNNQIEYFSNGYDLNGYHKDTVVFLREIKNSSYTINKLTFSSTPIDKALSISPVEKVIDTIFSNSKIRWVSIEPLADRFTYSIGNTIYVSTPQAISPKRLVTATANRPLILDYNLIIYTGVGGRFYYSDYDGVNNFPFWGTMNNSD